MVPPPLSTLLSDCYGDEGARLAQLFDICFQSQDELCQVNAILLMGDSGIGKSTVLDMIAAQHGLKVSRAVMGEMSAQHEGQFAIALERLAWEIQDAPKGLLIIEDIDLLFPKKDTSIQEPGLLPALQRILRSFQNETHAGRAIVVATTRDPYAIQGTVRSLFEDEIVLQIPTPNERHALLQHLAQGLQLDKNVSLEALSAQAHAFVAADLARWCQLALEAAHADQSEIVCQHHFESTFDRIRVNALQMAEKPDPVRWSDIGGLQEAKQALEESAVWVYKHAAAYKRLGIRPSKGVLLYGPPGTGKTLLAKAVATESSANFMAVSIPDLIKGEVGESEKAVVSIFQTAIRCSPCVIFFDELEAIFSSRETSGDVGKKLISQFLIEIDHLDKTDQSVILLGATNHPESIDTSILRPGRLDRMIHVGLPSKEERLNILHVLARGTRLDSQVDLDTIADCTESYSGADLKAVVRKAALIALKNSLRIQQDSPVYVEQQHLLEAIQVVGPSHCLK
ncbi:aaa family cdc48 subfamily [Lichtheimia corymbifera JMRC:FSU:9682]|uniref:Aaa family cdc48 subfamily n=1 Tax=Lichtheimia corymbifera JMRC:FSU:9682 TaxID=1263082 RepID=A0A068RKS6_9FUNG|nr:aaa family cdc48 subfamily [Lichtheimia corymbifera JMRC:FSU:9682]